MNINTHPEGQGDREQEGGREKERKSPSADGLRASSHGKKEKNCGRDT